MSSEATVPEPMSEPGKEKVLDAVLEDLKARAEIGKEKYKTYLMTFNGRDALVDAYQEALDLVMYLKQELMERKVSARIGRCEGCGSIIEDKDILPYGDEFCHAEPVQVGNDEWEPNPCGPVHVFHEVVTRRKA